MMKMMMMNNKDNQLIYKINGKEYLLIEFVLGNTNLYASLLKRLLKIDAIEQSLVLSRGGFFGTTYIISKFLVPTKNIDEYKKVINPEFYEK